MALSELFSSKGWRHEKGALGPERVADLVNFLKQRHQIVRESFEAWVGRQTDLSYAEHQARLPEYETREIPPDFRNFLVGQFDLETRLDPIVQELLSTPALMDRLKDFCRTDEYFVHYPPMIRFKVPEAKESLVPVHQDTAYNQHLSDFMTAWLPLTDIDDDCGGIIVYEGSQFADEVPHQASGAWANRSSVDLSDYSPTHVHMKAGDLLLFPKNLFHESAPHRSERIRYSIDFRIFPRPEDTTKSYYDPQARTIVRKH